MTSGATSSSLVICLEHLHFVLELCTSGEFRSLVHYWIESFTPVSTKSFSLLEGTSRTLVSSRTEKFKCLVETDRKAHRKLICKWMIEGNALT